MAVPATYKLDLIGFPSSNYVKQITDSSVMSGLNTVTESPAGHRYPMFLANDLIQPSLEFSSTQLKTLLGLIPPGGIGIAAVTPYFKAAAATGNVARATTSHYKTQFNNVVACVQSIELNTQGPARARVQIMPSYDGTNAPVVYTGSVALPVSLVATELFTLGPTAINGTAVSGVKSVTINFGVQLVPEQTDGEQYPTFVHIDRIAPTVRIQTIAAVNWATYGLGGLALNGTTGWATFARRYEADKSRYADNASQHLEWQASFGKVVPQGTTGRGVDLVTDDLLIQLRTNADTDDAITYTPDVAIA